MANQVQHTNRFGKTYFLSCSRTKKGNVRYVFRAEPAGDPVTEIPDGYEITEGISGVVSLAKKRKPIIEQAELALVREVLTSCRNGALHEAAIKKDAVVVYHRIGVHPRLAAALGCDFQASKPSFQEVLRFVLLDAKSRSFGAERMFFSGNGSWLPLGRPSKLGQLAKKYLPHVGEDSFYELL